MKRKVKILILCGGQGKRMGSVTTKIPKPLAKIGNYSILHRKILNYSNQGFNDFIIAVGYKGDVIMDYITKLTLPIDIKIEFSDAGENAGILDRINFARSLFDESIIITYGDTFTNIDLIDFINKHNNSDNLVTIVTAPFKNPFGLVDINSDNKVTSFVEKPILKYYIGYAILNKKLFADIPKKIIKAEDGNGLISLYNMLILQNKLGSYYFDGLDVTFNTEAELAAAEEKIIDFFTIKET